VADRLKGHQTNKDNGSVCSKMLTSSLILVVVVLPSADDEIVEKSPESQVKKYFVSRDKYLGHLSAVRVFA